jgi:hypothetical protein
LLPLFSCLSMSSRRAPPAVAFRERRATLGEAIEEGARLFSVSHEVILRRFLTDRAITSETYRQTSVAWKRARRQPAKRKGGPVPQHTIRANELGASSSPAYWPHTNAGLRAL